MTESSPLLTANAATTSSASPLSDTTITTKRKKAVYCKDYVLQYEMNRQRVLAEQEEFFHQFREKQIKSRKEHQKEKRNAYQRERRRLKKLKEQPQQACGNTSNSSSSSSTSSEAVVASVDVLTTKLPIELSISFLLN
ncbi:Aste57867_16879 [Aphanomyces stellatus]|uniref:Aste57867_16879 protein n=1 Tax=Aphanomyces stellatus TaxID=120398 RepID=A0A485L6G1_9STRA|nr:hypothetical protein As57867_016821 [Aphanomyces stellatus]VFT93642.1 Aste57867_16879 [Aphanomyces stellatus]